MKKYIHLINIVFLFTMVSCIREYSTVEKQELHKGWWFTGSDTLAYYPAEVPGCIHTGLMMNGVIEDPFFGDNENKVQWVGEKDWICTDTFNLKVSMAVQDHIDLVFEGLDTRCDVFLNGRLILETDNMFREYKLPVKDVLRPKDNILKIFFYSPVEYVQNAADTASIPLPDKRAYLRKAPYQFGWDWGADLPTSGIWKPVYLEGWDNARMMDVHYETVRIHQDSARVKATIRIESDDEHVANIKIIDEITGEVFVDEMFDLKEGIHEYPLEFVILNPKLWWPNGLGIPHLYPVTCNLKLLGKTQVVENRIGLRIIEVIHEKDRFGKSFYFKVNDKPVFIKGANYIPLDHFPSRAKRTDYVRLLSDARSSHMNMLRVWGGGIYESDFFYDLCDELGIMVWQDFMYACNMYPGNKDFLENAENEAIDQVVRLRNHPCIALWCGNNEVNEGWHNWGWQEQLGYTKEDSVKVWQDYQKLFHEVLPAVVKKYDFTEFYWPSSPKYGWGREEAYKDGDVHYWGVWWGEDPFETYREKTGRFMSEYGFQGFPDMQTIKAFTNPADRHLDSEVLAVHQKHPRGFELIDTYMERWFEVPEDFEGYVYTSQILQAEGIRMAIESHRKAMPFCMGTLYWQLNDTWPVISWSGMDYYGRWKALQYFVEKAYRETILVFEEKGDSIFVYSVTDKYQPFPAILELKFWKTDGKLLKESMKDVEVLPGSNRIWAGKKSEMARKAGGAGNAVLEAELIMDKAKYQVVHYFTIPKRVRLQDPDFMFQFAGEGKAIKVLISAKKPSRYVCLGYPGDDVWFEKDFFDLMPGDTVEVMACPAGKINVDTQKIEIKSLWDIRH